MRVNKISRATQVASLVLMGYVAPFALSQDNGGAKTSASALMEEVVVTATKKASAENVQDIPVAITAYSGDQLDAMKVRDLQSLTYSAPNVALDDVGTTKGVANFSIRGLGVNSSIPSIDPTVGVFVDGMYLGINAGVVLDLFDLSSVEVLRGPQGILFGRNTTGGAVLINTRKPTDEPEAKVKIAAESGFRGTGVNYYAMGSYSAPIVDNVLSAKLAVYYNNDGGWHKNSLPGSDIEDRVTQIGGTPAALLGLGLPVARNTPDGTINTGQSETMIVRPSLFWTPSEQLEVSFRYEHGEVEADGAVIQNHPGANGVANPYSSFSRDSFNVSNDEIGFLDNEWDQFIAEVRYDLGDAGVITSISGWRDYSSLGRSDIDGTPIFGFHADIDVWQEQVSQELRYNRNLSDSSYLTLGLYYFDQDIIYNEDRQLLGGAVFLNGGGIQNQSTKAVFGQVDFDISDSLTLNIGARYTYEDKDAVISTLSLNSVECDPRIPGECSEDFKDKASWNNFTPKLGFSWAASDDINVYAHWTKGVRSGGYNFRNSNQAIPPGPFDEEIINAFEIGFKSQSIKNGATFNAAIFLNDVSDMQREVIVADPTAGTSQVIRNTADARIYGLEIETRTPLTENLILQASAGYTHGEYRSVLFDLSGDGTVDSADKSLEIPRLSPWTWGVGLVHTGYLSDGLSVDSVVSYGHRHASFYTDDNKGRLNAVNALDASITLKWNDFTLGLYGKNLLDEVNHGTDTQLPGVLGFGAVGTLMKGRVMGLELNLKF